MELQSGLFTHLCSCPTAISQLFWVPDKLKNIVLGRLTFTILRTEGENTVCKWESAEQIGTHKEQWIFKTPSGERFPVFGTEAIAAIALTA
jgi:hypothetical protein